MHVRLQAELTGYLDLKWEGRICQMQPMICGIRCAYFAAYAVILAFSGRLGIKKPRRVGKSPTKIFGIATWAIVARRQQIAPSGKIADHAVLGGKSLE